MKGLCLPSGDVTPLTMWWGPWLWGHNAGDGGRVTLVGTGDTLVGAWCCVTLLGTRGLSPLWGQGTPWWGCGVVTAFCGAWGTSVAFGDTPGDPCDIWVQSLETFMAIGNTLWDSGVPVSLCWGWDVLSSPCCCPVTPPETPMGDSDTVRWWGWCHRGMGTWGWLSAR